MDFKTKEELVKYIKIKKDKLSEHFDLVYQDIVKRNVFQE